MFSTNCFRRRLLQRGLGRPNYSETDALIRSGKLHEALVGLNRWKARNLSDGRPDGVDYYRGLVFLHMKDALGARQAFLEEVRCSPRQGGEFADPSHELILTIEKSLPDYFSLPQEVCETEPEFTAVYLGVFRHSMLHWKRLLSLFTRVREAAEQSLSGDIVECGVAAGGSTVVVAVAASLYFASRSPTVHAFDTFRGMPATDDGKDRRLQDNALATDIGWAAGTCSAPPDCLVALARKYGVQDHIRVVEGDFSHTISANTMPKQGICVAHVDADWYHSTRVCLPHIYPALVRGGLLQLDDYQYWSGCHEAVGEYFGNERPQLHDIDGNAVWLRKP